MATTNNDPRCPLCGEPCDRVEVCGITLSGCPCVGTGDRAVAIDLSKLTKDPASRGYSFSEYVEKAKQLAASPIDPAIFERMRAETDRAIANLATHAGRMETVLMLAQYGTIASEEARELLEMPDVTSAWSERPPTTAIGDRVPVYLKSRTENPPGALFKYSSTCSHAPVDPLDVMHDGWVLRDLLEIADAIAQERACDARLPAGLPIPMTALQRDAVSAYRSAELRAKIAASKERDRRQVTIEVDE